MAVAGSDVVPIREDEIDAVLSEGPVRDAGRVRAVLSKALELKG